MSNSWSCAPILRSHPVPCGCVCWDPAGFCCFSSVSSAKQSRGEIAIGYSKSFSVVWGLQNWFQPRSVSCSQSIRCLVFLSQGKTETASGCEQRWKLSFFIMKCLGLISGESLVSSCSVLNSAPSTTPFSATEETNIPAGLYFSQNLVAMTFIYW